MNPNKEYLNSLYSEKKAPAPDAMEKSSSDGFDLELFKEIEIAYRQKISKLIDLSHDVAWVDFEGLNELLDNCKKEIIQVIEERSNNEKAKFSAINMAYGRIPKMIFDKMTYYLGLPKHSQFKSESENESNNNIRKDIFAFLLKRLKQNLDEKETTNVNSESGVYINPEDSIINATVRAFSNLVTDFEWHNFPLIKDSINKKDVIDTLCRVFSIKENNTKYINLYGIAEIFSSDVGYSSAKLFELMSQIKDKDAKKMAGKTLLILELGRVGISKEGVNYLNKLFDLQDMNNPDFFVQRLTAKGDIGVFDEKKVLQKYFNISQGDLTGSKKVIKPALLDITYETLYYPHEGESKEDKEEREVFLKEFKEDYFEFYDDDFFQKTGVAINNLNFKEQGWFLIYYKNSNQDDRDKLLDFVHQYRENGLRTFLSLEFGQHIGKEILNIGSQLKEDPDLAVKLFQEFNNITSEANVSTEEFVEIYNKIFYNKQINRSEANKAVLRNAYSLLAKVSKQISSLEDDKKEETINTLIKELKGDNEAQRQAISDFASLAKDLNSYYGKLVDELVIHDMGWIFGDPDQYKSPNELNEAIKNGEIEPWWMNMEWMKNPKKMFEKFDAGLIKKIIAASQRTIRNIKEENRDYFGSEEAKKYGKIDPIGETFERYDKLIGEEKIKIQKFEKLLSLQQNLEQKLDQFVYGQEQAGLPDNFEKGIEDDIADYQPELKKDDRPYFPVGISSSLPKKGEKHAKPIDSLAYLFWLKNQGVPAELMVVDTIQTTNYQASYGLSEKQAREKALENGQRDKDFYRSVIKAHGLGDAISLTDYRQVEEYSKTREYQDLVDSLDDKKRCAPIARALNGLVEGSRRRDSHEAGQESKEEKEKKDALLRSYGKSEIAFILSKPEMKVGHEKEFRYDIIASVIPVFKALEDNLPALEEILKKNGIKNTTQHTSSQELIDLSFYLAYYTGLEKDEHDELTGLFGERSEIRTQLSTARKEKKELEKSNFPDEEAIKRADQKIKDIQASTGRFREKISSQTGNSSLLYRLGETAQDDLKLINKNPQEIISKWKDTGDDIKKTDWYNKISLPRFSYPKNVGSQSFEMKKEGKGEFMGFREPYSTYKSSSEEELMINANQLVASTSLLAPAKLMVLSREKQDEYCQKVLRPLLVNYYLATSKNKEEALNKFHKDAVDTKTITDIVRLVREKVIRPIEEIMK